MTRPFAAHAKARVNPPIVRARIAQDRRSPSKQATLEKSESYISCVVDHSQSHMEGTMRTATVGPRVWIYEERTWGQLGQRRWLAEWYEIKPAAKARIDADPDHEIDWDHDLLCATATAKTKDAAVRKARAILDSGRSFCGAVLVNEQVVDWMCEEDRVGAWEDVGESEEVS